MEHAPSPYFSSVDLRDREGRHRMGRDLTLTTRGSGWDFSSWSSSTCTGPPLTMLPPRKSWIGRGRA